MALCAGAPLPDSSWPDRFWRWLSCIIRKNTGEKKQNSHGFLWERVSLLAGEDDGGKFSLLQVTGSLWWQRGNQLSWHRNAFLCPIAAPHQYFHVSVAAGWATCSPLALFVPNMSGGAFVSRQKERATLMAMITERGCSLLQRDPQCLGSMRGSFGAQHSIWHHGTLLPSKTPVCDIVQGA